MSRREAMGHLLGFAAVVVAVSLALLGLFAVWGRAAAGRGRSGAIHLVFTGWGGLEERRVFTYLVEEFERRHPEIEVDYRPVPTDYLTKLTILFAGGTPPDVFYLPDSDFPRFVAQGRCLNLQPYVAGSRVIRADDFWPSALIRYRFDGRRFGRGDLYALPKDIGPYAMYVNVDLFRRGGETPPPPNRPLTWSEALALWQRLTRDDNGDGRIDVWGVHGFLAEAAVWSHGGDFLSADGRRFTLPEDERGLEALQWLADLQAKHRVAPQQRQREAVPVDAMFLTGRLACFIGGRWMVPLFRQARFDWDVAPIPVSDRTRRPAGISGSVGLAIAPECRHPEAAWQLIEFLAGPEGQAAQARTGFQIPNQRSLSLREVFLQPGQRPAHAEVFVAAARYQQPNPATRTPDPEWWTLFHQRLDPVFRGEVSVAERVRQVAPEVQRALDRGWQLLERR